MTASRAFFLKADQFEVELLNEPVSVCFFDKSSFVNHLLNKYGEN